MIIKESNREKIEKMIKEAEGRATARTMSYMEILEAIRDIEEHLGIPKKEMIGIKADVDYNAQTFPSAYRYTPESTHIVMVKKSSGWDLQVVCRCNTRRANHQYQLNLIDEAKKAVIESMSNF